MVNISCTHASMPSLIKADVPLAPYTTLGVGGHADHFVEVRTDEEIKEALNWAHKKHLPITILGGGSNVLISDKGIPGLVIFPTKKSIRYEENGNELLVTVGSGAELDNVIEEFVSKELWGLENLSGIPGTVGGVPIQNVGAYGVEACDVVDQVRTFDTDTGEVKTFSNTECAFQYRHSFFKTPWGRRYLIDEVTIKLSRVPSPILNYKDVQAHFGKRANPTLSEIREAIKTIRKGKFPDWHTHGTAGSFFKNPIVSKETYNRLLTQYPDLPGFVLSGGEIKISLAWILDHACGLRGYREGNVGLYDKHALVLIAEHGATAQEIKMFAQKISDTVFEKTNIEIEYEVTPVP